MYGFSIQVKNKWLYHSSSHHYYHMSTKGAHLIIQNSWIKFSCKLIKNWKFLYWPWISEIVLKIHWIWFNLLYDPLNWQGQIWYQTGGETRRNKPLNTPTLDWNFCKYTRWMFNIVLCDNYNKIILSLLECKNYESINKWKELSWENKILKHALWLKLHGS